MLPEKMMSEMARSTFCLLPGGDSPDAQRLAIAVSVNCIPVIIARFYGDGADIDVEHRRGASTGSADGEPSTSELPRVAAKKKDWLRRQGEVKRDGYIRRYKAGSGVSTREDWFFYTPFADAIDYSSFAVLVDPVEFVNQPHTWLPDRLAAIAANATLVDAMLLSLARAARHLVYDELGSDVGNMALLSASRHCLARPTDRLPTEEERRAALAAGASWSPDEELGGYL